MQNEKYQVKGVNDDRDFCECCGKTGLSKVVWIESLETGEVRHFGTTCAKNAKKAFGLKSEIDAAVRSFESKEQSLWRSVRINYRKQGGKFVTVMKTTIFKGKPITGPESHPENKELWFEIYKTLKTA